MYATLSQIDGIPGPQDTAWVDEVLTALRTTASPVGALIARPIGPGAGYAVTFWAIEDDAASVAEGRSVGDLTIGAARTYDINARHTSGDAQPAHYLQLLTFDGPRTAEWSASYERAGEERMLPAVRNLPGWLEHFAGSAADNSKLSITLAASVEALEAAGAAIMSTELLPGEDPAQLTGPDSFAILRLLHADVPVGADK